MSLFPPPAPLITNEMLMQRAEKEREQQALLEAEQLPVATPSSTVLQQQQRNFTAECSTSGAAQEEQQQEVFIEEEVCEWDPFHRQATTPIVQRVGVPASALLASLHSYEQAAVTCANNAASDEQSQWSC